MISWSSAIARGLSYTSRERSHTQHAMARLAEQRRGHRAARAEADDGDVEARAAITSGGLVATIGLRSVPMRSISISIASPAFIHTGGVRAWPTPAGVPITITSPGSSVMHSASSAIVSATPKIMSVVFASCITWPFRRLSMCSPIAPGGSSSAVTSTGPKPPVASKFLPMVHCGVRFW